MIAVSSRTTFRPFFPEAMMRRGELAKAHRMLRKLDCINDQSRSDEQLPKSERKGYAAFSQRRQPVWAEMDSLAADVWRREVGLERYSVVRIQREDAEYELQVLSFSFRDGLPWELRWMWELEGRVLRKDGTLGSKGATSIGFRHGNLYRRHLDGLWRELRWFDEGAG